MVFETLAQMRERGLDPFGSREGAPACFAAAIQACTLLSSDGSVSEEAWDKAWGFYSLMCERGLTPAKETFRTLIAMACEARDTPRFQAALRGVSKAYGHRVVNEDLSRELIAFHLYQDRMDVVWKMYERPLFSSLSPSLSPSLPGDQEDLERRVQMMGKGAKEIKTRN